MKKIIAALLITLFVFASVITVGAEYAPVSQYTGDAELQQRYRDKFYEDINGGNMTFDIYTADALKVLAEIMNENYYNFQGCTIVLHCDMRFNTGDASTWQDYPPEYVWEPITRFEGTFDGQGHVIYGLYSTALETKYAGFFERLYSGTVVRNLGISNSYFEGNYVGGIAAIISNSCVYISGCMFDGVLNASTNGTIYIGGICGRASGEEIFIEQCATYGTYSQYNDFVARIGGIVGYAANASSSVNISDCVNFAKILSAYTTRDYTGGIVGHPYYDTSVGMPRISVKNCVDYTDETIHGFLDYGVLFGTQDGCYDLNGSDVTTKGSKAINALPALSFSGSDPVWRVVVSDYPLPSVIYNMLTINNNESEPADYFGEVSIIYPESDLVGEPEPIFPEVDDHVIGELYTEPAALENISAPNMELIYNYGGCTGAVTGISTVAIVGFAASSLLRKKKK